MATEPVHASGETPPAFLSIDTESVLDAKLLGKCKCPSANYTHEHAIARAQDDARENSPNGSDFLPVTYHVPVAACVIRACADYTLQAITCLDAPQYRPRKIVEQFWSGLV